MAGEWGTREEFQHPRDSHGRFRNSFKMSGAAIEKISTLLEGFNPKTFPTNEDAAKYTNGIAASKQRGPRANKLMERLLANYPQMNAKLRARDDSGPDIAAMDASMAPLPDQVILSRVVGPEAFGLKPESIARMEEYTGKLVADRGYSSTNIGTPLAGGQGPSITMVIAVPAGTRAVVPSADSPTREVVLDREQPLRITKVTPDGKGGFYVMAVATEKGSVGNKRTKKLGTRLRKGQEEKDLQLPETPVTAPAPAQAPNAPQQAPAVQAPTVEQGPVRPKQGRPAGPGPGERNEPVAAESIGPGGKTAKPADQPQPAEKAPEVAGPAPKASPTPAPEPAPAATPEAPKAPAKGEPKPTPEPGQLPSHEEVALRIQAEEREKRRRFADERRQREDSQARRDKDQERKSREVAAEQRRLRAEADERAALDAQVMEIGARIGEPPPKDQMTRRLLALMDDSVKSHRVSRKKAAQTVRGSSLRNESPEHKRFLDKYADSLAPEVAVQPDSVGLIHQTVPELRAKARDEKVTIPKSVRTKDAIVDFLADKLAEKDATTREAAPQAPVAVPTPAKAAPARLTPSMAVGKTNASRVEPGTTVLVRQRPDGTWEASTTKTGATPMTVTRKQAIQYKGRGGVRVSGTGPDGQEITIKDGPGIQTFWVSEPGAARPARATKPKLSDTEQVDLVKQAYEDLRKGGDFVSIADLRDRMTKAGLSRAEQDRILTRLERDPSVNIVPQSNQKVLTDRERAAAIHIGGQDKHALFIEPTGRIGGPAPEVGSVAPKQWGEVPTWLSGKSDDELQKAMRSIFNRPPSPARDIALDAIDAELTRREGVKKLEARSRDIDTEADAHLESGGAYTDLDMDPTALEHAQRLGLIDANRRPGERREQALRRMYKEHVHNQWLQAEEDTNGVLLNRAGVQAGISPLVLWGASLDRARKYSSPELAQWWADHGGRSTYDDFRAQWLGGRAARQAAEAKRGKGRGRDFEL